MMRSTDSAGRLSSLASMRPSSPSERMGCWCFCPAGQRRSLRGKPGTSSTPPGAAISFARALPPFWLRAPILSRRPPSAPSSPRRQPAFRGSSRPTIWSGIGLITPELFYGRDICDRIKPTVPMAEFLKSHHFSDFLKPAQVVYELQAKEKVRAIEELLDVLLKEKLIRNKKLILTRLIDREQLESTAIGEYVALPHARVDSGGQIAIAVGRSEKGIDFDSIDKKKVHLIILVVWNPTLPGLFNHLFAGLARFLRKPEYRQRLFDHKNNTELVKVPTEIAL